MKYYSSLLLLVLYFNETHSKQDNQQQILATQRPVLHLSFDDGTGSDLALDTSINMNDGVLTNMDSATDWVAGVAGLAIDTDGVNDFINVADDDSLDFGTSDFTVSYWFNKRSDDNGGFSFGVNKWHNGGVLGTNEWALSPTNGFANPQTNKITFVVEIDNTLYILVDSNSFNLNEWQHVVGVRENTHLTLYLNGVLVATNDLLPPNGSINNVGRDLRIGNSDTQGTFYPMDGQFDDLQIYRLAATDGEVAIGERATGDIAFLFNNPGMELSFEENVFKNGFED